MLARSVSKCRPLLRHCWTLRTATSTISGGHAAAECGSSIASKVSTTLLCRRPYSAVVVDIPDEHRDKFDPENPNLTKYEVVADPDVWKYVEQLMPDRAIKPCPNEPGPSGWKPPTLTRERARKLPYFVKRTRNYMIPVYLEVEPRGPRNITYVRKIQGDPWILRNEVRAHLQKLQGNAEALPIRTKVNELTMTVGFLGNFVEEITEFLIKKGF